MGAFVAKRLDTERSSMSYERFKRQLYENISELEPARSARIGILEKGVNYEDEIAQRVIRAVNLSDQGREEVLLQEDLLYAVWEEEPSDYMLYWPVWLFYERFRAEGWQGVLPELAVALNRDMGEQELPIAPNDIFVRHRANLILRPFSLEENREELEDCVYWEWGDIVLVLYLLVYDEPGNFMSLKLERSMTEKWHKGDAVLLTGALLNCMSKMPPRLFYGQDSLRYYDEKGGVFLPGEKGIPIRIDPKDVTQGFLGYRLTTIQRLNGAIAIFYPGVRERIASLLQGDFYVVFKSVNEVGIYPVRLKPLSSLRAEVEHDNALLRKKQFLSGRIYRYVELRRELMEV